MRHEIYHPGGFRSDLPNGNRAELWDSGSGLFQRWDASGNVIEERPLSAAESEALADPPAPPKTAAEIAAEHATIETIADMEAFRAALEQLGSV